MALTRIKTDQIASGQVKSDDLDPNISLPAGTVFSDNSISGNAIDGGTISNFASTGIDDNATTTALTIDSNGSITCTGALGVSGNTTSTSTTTGALTVAGGVGIAGALNVGGEILATSLSYNNGTGSATLLSTSNLSSTLNSGSKGFQIITSASFTAKNASNNPWLIANDNGVELYSGAQQKLGVTSDGVNVTAGALTVPDQSKYEYTASVYPKVKPTLSLDFTNSESVDKRITFTRSTNATYYDANGILRTAYADQPRIDFDPATGECKGLLIEEQRTNILPHSTNLTTAPWYQTNVILVPNSAIAPDGAHTALKVIATVGSARHTLDISTAIVSSTTLTVSCYAKAAERNVLHMHHHGGGIFARFNLSNGTVIAVTSGPHTAKIESVGNGWYKCSLTGYDITSTVAGATYTTIGNGDTSSEVFNGDGISGIYIWGAQLEAGTFATSYIPTAATFTSRASSATYYDSTGVLRIAGTNQPRYGYGYDTVSGKWVSQGLVLESAATNIQLSSNVGTWQNNNQCVVYNGFASPDGNNNAVKIARNTTATYHDMTNIFSSGTAINTDYVYSFYLTTNNGGVSTIFFQTNYVSGGTQWVNCSFDVSTLSFIPGSNTTRGGVVDVGGGWYRCWFIVNTPVAVSYMSLHPISAAPAAGDNTTGNILWGFQMEAGSYPTSHIPTFGASATRAADVSASAATTRVADLAYLQLENFSSWYNSTLGTAYAEWNCIGGTQPAFSFQKSTASTTNHWTLSSTSGTYSYFSSANGVSNGSLNGPSNGVLPGVFHKIAVAAQANNFAISLNGLSAVSVSSGAVIPDVDRVVLTGTYNLAGTNAWIKKFSYYPKRLSNAELQAITE